MATYSRADRLKAIQAAGFKNPMTALAVSLAEFGENRDINAQSQSDVVSGGVREDSWGPWQIHLPDHKDVSQSCAMDLTCSTKVAYKLSGGGTNFSKTWSAYDNGSYLRFLSEITASLKDIAPGLPSSSPSPSGGGGGGSAAPADCRSFSEADIARAAILNWQGNPVQHIADELGVTLGCLKQRVGDAIGEINKNPGVQAADKAGAAANTLTTGAKSASEFFAFITQSDNIWRAGFVILGAAMMFIGARLYLKPDAASEQAREAVHG